MFRTLFFAGAFSASLSCGAFGASAAHWTAVPGAQLDGVANKLMVSDLSGVPSLYVGGDFDNVGAVSASKIARFDGAAWHSVGSALNGSVDALVVANTGDGPKLCAAGSFFLSNPSGWTRTVARLIDGVWQPPAGAPGPNTWNGWLAAYDDGSGERLYTSGGWDVGGGMSYVARWNSAGWSPLGSGLVTIVNDSMAFTGAGAGRSLWLAGGLGPVGMSPLCLGMVRWDGAWHCDGGGLNGPAYAIAAYDDGRGTAVYVGGGFSAAGQFPDRINASRMARWDGAKWEPLGLGMPVSGGSGDVLALEVFDDGRGPALYAAGGFTVAGTQSASHIARWDGAAWEAVDAGINGVVNDLVVFDPDGPGLQRPALYAAGSFTLAGSATVRNVAALVVPPPVCPADLTGDGIVNTADLTTLLGRFGLVVNPGALGDINGDGVVNTADLTFLLGAFGTNCV